MSASEVDAPRANLLLVWSGTCGDCGREIETLVPSTGVENPDAVKQVLFGECGNIAGVTESKQPVGDAE